MSLPTPTPDLEELERSRRELSLAVAEAKPGALEELGRVEAEIFGVRLQIERERLADEQRAADEVAAAQKRSDDERRRHKGQLEAVRNRLPKLAEAVDKTLADLVERLHRLLEAGAEADRLGHQLGQTRREYVDRDRVAAILRGRLNRILPQGFARSSLPWSRVRDIFGE